MANNIPWHTIFKSFQNKATSEEIELIDEWLKHDAENLKILNEIYNIYSISVKIPEPINPDKQKAWEKINKHISKKEGLTAIKRLKIAIAAAAVILILITTFNLNNYFIRNQSNKQYTEVIAPMGQKTLVILPDSSLVWLNSGSSLKYKGGFNIKEREVLLKGEAFFEVKKDESKQFRVSTGILFIDVYGTAFNIKNYNDDSILEVTVSEGKVGISDKAREIKQLIKGDQAILDKSSNKINFKKTNPEIISSWKNNELIFDNSPIEEVVKYLERWYGVNINIDKNMVGKHNYTFNIKTESFRELMEMMKVMTPLEYKIDGKNIKIRYTN